jgi:hypothetical protein
MGFFSDHRVILDTCRIKSSGHRMWRTGPLLFVHPRTSKARRMKITKFHPWSTMVPWNGVFLSFLFPFVCSFPCIPCSFLVVVQCVLFFIVLIRSLWFGLFLSLFPESFGVMIHHDISPSLEAYVHACLPRPTSPWHSYHN